jgi:3-oxoadipate enol-lactonase/4-carboxymuconolactone decarboxylase
MPWPSHGDVLARGIAGARALRLDTAHLSNLEAPRAFTTAVLEFLLESPDSTYDRGMAVRRAVLGDAHVDRAVAGTTRSRARFRN